MLQEGKVDARDDSEERMVAGVESRDDSAWRVGDRPVYIVRHNMCTSIFAPQSSNDNPAFT
jgi:hypothetical protein